MPLVCCPVVGVAVVVYPFTVCLWCCVTKCASVHIPAQVNFQHIPWLLVQLAQLIPAETNWCSMIHIAIIILFSIWYLKYHSLVIAFRYPQVMADSRSNYSCAESTVKLYFRTWILSTPHQLQSVYQGTLRMKRTCQRYRHIKLSWLLEGYTVNYHRQHQWNFKGNLTENQ